MENKNFLIEKKYKEKLAEFTKPENSLKNFKKSNIDKKYDQDTKSSLILVNFLAKCKAISEEDSKNFILDLKSKKINVKDIEKQLPVLLQNRIDSLEKLRDDPLLDEEARADVLAQSFIVDSAMKVLKDSGIVK